MARILKPFPEKGYNEIIKEVGQFRYKIFEKDEAIPGEIFKETLNFDPYNCVIAGTGSTLALCSLDLGLSERYTIPKGVSVVICRLLRYDNSHGEPHYNADDQIIFPTSDGSIWRLPRKTAPDHYVQIAETADMFTLGDAYHLPKEKSGEIGQYTAQGARLYIDLLPNQ